MRKNWLNNLVVVLTGASSGIGKDITKILIKKYNCQIIGIGRNEEKMVQVVSELGELAKNFSYKLFDVSEEKNWIDFNNYLNSLNIKINLLINCAGVLPIFEKFEDMQINKIDEVMKVNFYSCVYSMHYLLPNLLGSKIGGIVNVSSSAALCPLPGISIYTASKAALKNLTESVRYEFKKRIYVGLVCPGFTKTNIFRHQSANVSKSIIGWFSCASLKMANKIVRGISRKKRKLVLGIDAKVMNFLYKVFPNSACAMCGNVMKLSKLELFEKVFKKEEKID